MGVVLVVAAATGQPAGRAAVVPSGGFGPVEDSIGAGLQANYNYDFRTPQENIFNTDFPDAMLFYDWASVPKVYDHLPATWNYGPDFGTGLASSHKFGYVHDSRVGGGYTWSDSAGKKEGVAFCGGQTAHIHPYAPGNTFFYNIIFGYFVYATMHTDVDEVCLSSSATFGYTEGTEHRMAGIFGGTNFVDYGWINNYEPLHNDISEPNHVWANDGKATYVHFKS